MAAGAVGGFEQAQGHVVLEGRHAVALPGGRHEHPWQGHGHDVGFGGGGEVFPHPGDGFGRVGLLVEGAAEVGQVVEVAQVLAGLGLA